MRTFISIDVPQFDTILNFQRELAHFGKMKLVEPQNLHFTLKFLGEISSVKLNDIYKLLQHINFKKFSIQLKGCGAFPSMKYIKIVWIGVTSNRIALLSEKIDMMLSKLGFTPERDHIAHLTVARVKTKLENKTVFEKYKDFEFGSFYAENIKIKKSVLHSTGPKYEDLYVIELNPE